MMTASGSDLNFLEEAANWWASLDDTARAAFVLTIIDVFPGVKWALTHEAVRTMLAKYDGNMMDDLLKPVGIPPAIRASAGCGALGIARVDAWLAPRGRQGSPAADEALIFRAWNIRQLSGEHGFPLDLEAANADGFQLLKTKCHASFCFRQACPSD